MKKKWLIALVSIITALAVVCGSVWFVYTRLQKNTVGDLSRIAMPGKEIFIDIYKSTISGKLPDGWDKTHPYVFLRDADKSTALATEGGNNSHLCVKHTDKESWLGFCGQKGANILTLPEISEEDFLISFTLSFDAFKFPFGIAVGIDSDYKNATEATVFEMSSLEEGEKVFVPHFSTYTVSATDENFVGEITNRKDYPVVDILPDIIVRNQNTGSQTIPSDQDLNIKFYRYDGVYYFYCNDVLISTLEDPNPNGRIGFLSDCDGREVKVKELKITKIAFADQTADTVHSAYTKQDVDFGSVDAMPEDWMVNPEGSAKVENGMLNISGGDTSVILPYITPADYLTEVTLKIPEKGIVGIADNITRDQSYTNGCFAVYDADSNTLRQYNSSSGNDTESKTYSVKDIDGLSLKKGDMTTFKIYHIDNVNYFYINDTFISYLPAPEMVDADGASLTTTSSGIFLKSAAQTTVSKVKITLMAKKGGIDGILALPGKVMVEGSTVKYNLGGILEKDNIIYLGTGGGAWNPDTAPLFGFVYKEITQSADEITLETEGVKRLEVAEFSETDTEVNFTSEYIEISTDNPAAKIVARPFLMLKDGEENIFFYGKSATFSPSKMASDIYPDQTDDTKAIFDQLFKDCDDYIGKYEKYLTFSLFSDFHYKKRMYSTSVADMQSILDRANKAGASFIISAGDFCNDFSGSPELMNAFLNNSYSLPAYNVYGNHELESGGYMQNVTPLLTNDEKVVWGTKDGQIGDGSIGYYYFENSGFRIVCTDTNYSWNPSTYQWEHNLPGSYGPPEGNTQTNSLGPVQLEWLEEVLTDAAHQAIPCIIVSHATFASEFYSTASDAASVRAIFKKVNEIRRGTVMMAINGHYHSNRIVQSGEILYIDMNTTRNGVWRGTSAGHYTDDQTFEFVDYDASGNPISTEKISLNSLSMGGNTWFFEDPLSAIVKISPYGKIIVEGQESRWIYGVTPEDAGYGEEPRVSSGTWELFK